MIYMQGLFLNIMNMKDFRYNWNVCVQARAYIRALTVDPMQYK